MSVRLPAPEDPSGARRGWRAPAGLLVLAAAAGYFATFVRYGLNLGEEGDIAYLIYRTFCGQRPYIDFASAYTPGFFYANAAVFHLFGVSLSAIRWTLVAVNSAAVFGLYRLARLVVPPALAAVPALGYAALMLVFPGENASFNIAYPAWYVVLTWVGSTLALVHGLARRRLWWLAIAGVLVAVGCAFKPNVGAFNLAALVLTLLCISNATEGRFQRVLWWGMFVGVLASIAAVFRFHIAGRDARLLLWPVLAVGAVGAATAGRGRAAGLPASTFQRALASLLGSFAAATLPWLLHYWSQLGTDRFLSDVLSIGSRREASFYLPIRDLGMWDIALVVAALAAIPATRMIASSRISPSRLLLPAGLLCGFAALVVVWMAPMPEGFSRALTQRLQYLGFGAAAVLHWMAVAFVARSSLRDPRPRLAAMAIAVGAPLLYLGIYPRSDFFHWVLSAPLTLVLAVMLYWRLARRWMTGGAWPWLAALPGYALIAAFAWPSVSLGARLATARAGAFASLDLVRAPIVLEAGRLPRLKALHRTTQLIMRNSPATATLLGFPNLQLINFLTARHVPGRYGSFYPGWPDHLVEAEIINDLDAQRTPLVVTRNDVQLFFASAPSYFFLLRAYVQEHYEPAARVGQYDILRRRGLPPLDTAAVATDAQEPIASAEQPEGLDCGAAVSRAERTMPESGASLAPCWRHGSDAALQERAVHAARATHDPATAVALAEALRAATLAPRAALLAVRVIGEFGDAHSVPALVGARARLGERAGDELATTLFNIATYAQIGRSMLVPNVPGEESVRTDVPTCDAARAWLSDPSGDIRLHHAGAWIAGACGDRGSIPALRRLVATRNIGLQMVAGDALIRLGVTDGVVEPLLDALAEDDTLLPGVVFAWCRANPADAGRVLAATWRHGNDMQRETIALVAGALGDASLGEVLRAGIGDPMPRVRMASIWAAGILDIDARPQVERALRDDPAGQVREFARASIEWMARHSSRSSDPTMQP